MEYLKRSCCSCCCCCWGSGKNSFAAVNDHIDNDHHSEEEVDFERFQLNSLRWRRKEWKEWREVKNGKRPPSNIYQFWRWMNRRMKRRKEKNGNVWMKRYFCADRTSSLSTFLRESFWRVFTRRFDKRPLFNRGANRIWIRFNSNEFRSPLI